MEKTEAFHLLQKKVEELNHNGFKFELGQPRLKKGKWLISIKGKVSKDFEIENDGGIFSLAQGGQKLHFLKDDLVTHLLIEANGGPVFGKLMPNGWAKAHFEHLELTSIT